MNILEDRHTNRYDKSNGAKCNNDPHGMYRQVKPPGFFKPDLFHDYPFWVNKKVAQIAYGGLK